MKTIQSTETIEVVIYPEELLNDKWLTFHLLSKKLGEMEDKNRMTYKQLRSKLYNSRACNKYNIETIAGMRCIDIDEPMKTNTASLVLKFKRG